MSDVNSNSENIIIGRNIRNIRTNLNLTQEEFAEKLNINTQFVSQIERGVAGISIDTAINICKFAKCSPVHLFKGIITSNNIMDSYELLNARDKNVINQMIIYLLNTK